MKILLLESIINRALLYSVKLRLVDVGTEGFGYCYNTSCVRVK